MLAVTFVSSIVYGVLVAFVGKLLIVFLMLVWSSVPGKVTDLRSVQPEKTPLPTEVTVSGMTMLVRLAQFWNMPLVNEVSPSQFSSESDTLLLALLIPSIKKKDLLFYKSHNVTHKV